MERLVQVQNEDTELAKFLHARVVGQEAAVASIVSQYDKLMAKMNDPSRPISTILFLGPTGTGKTKLVESFCEYLFGEGQKPMTVNCGEYQLDQNIAKLIGSPAGYIGYGDAPVFAKEAVENRKTKDGRKLQVILFDEIEKAVEHKAAGAKGGASALFNLLLSIMDRGTINLSRGQAVSFADTIIFMTSNLGAREIEQCQGDEGKMQVAARESARKFFSPEQFNRLDETVVFKQLSQDQITLILDLEVVAVAERAKIEIEVDDDVRFALVKLGYDIRYGARELKRAVDRHVTRPLAGFISAGQMRQGNRMRLQSVEEGGKWVMAFFKLEGLAMSEEIKAMTAPVAEKAAPNPETKFRAQGYVRTMLDRKFRYGDSHGAKLYAQFKKRSFAAMTPEQMLRELEAEGWKTDNASPLAAVKYVMHDWTKKGWAELTSRGTYVVKE